MGIYQAGIKLERKTRTNSMRLITTIALALLGLTTWAQTSLPDLPAGALRYSQTLWLVPSDSTLWTGSAGNYAQVATRQQLRQLASQGYTKAQVDSAITAEKQGLSSVLGTGSDGNNLSFTNVNTGAFNNQIRVLGGAAAPPSWTTAGQIAVTRNNSEPFLSFHDSDGLRLAHIQAGQGTADTMRIWNHGALTAFYTDNNVIKRLDITRNGLFTEKHGQSSFWDRATRYPVVQNENRKGTFTFIFDDGLHTDTAVVTKFDSIGWKVGFALIAGQLTEFHKQRYLSYQRMGHEILSHSWSNERFDDTSPFSNTEARLDMRNSLDSLRKWGFNVTGWVTPYSQMKPAFVDILKDYYAYGFTTYFGTVNPGNQSGSYHTYNQDVRNLWRVSLEASSEADILAAITECVNQNGYMVFYAHAYPSTTISRAKLDAIVNHLKTYVNSQDAEVLLPSDAVNKYYLFNNSDRLSLNDTIGNRLSKTTGGFVSAPVGVKGGFYVERTINDSRVELDYEGGVANIVARNTITPVQSGVDIKAVNNADSEVTLLSIRTSGITTSQYRLSSLNTAPASATATGTTGEIRITATHIYVCIATNTWVRSALTTW